MSGHWGQLALIAVLILLNAVFAGSEVALISLRDAQLRRVERQGGGRGQMVAKLAGDPNRFLATIQIGITLAGFLASATAAVSLAAPLEPVLAFLGGAARPAAIILVTTLLAFLTLVLGELAPKRLAMQHAESWALLVARPLNFLAAVAAPIIWFLGKATDLIVRLAGGDPNVSREEITPGEVRDIAATQRGFTAEQRVIISGAVEITERTLREVMIPRSSVFCLDAGTPVPQARVTLAASGHSRAPVIEGTGLDDTVGFVHLRDLTSNDPGVSVGRVAHEPTLMPESLKVALALRRFKSERQQIALVVDEHGAVDGIVTVEDLLEEVVGEIYDETDRDVQAVRRADDGSLSVVGTFPIHDLPDIGVDLTSPPDGDYVTIAGLVIAALGYVPTEPGETINLGEWTAAVAKVDGRAVTEVTLTQVRRGRQNRPGEPMTSR